MAPGLMFQLISFYLFCLIVGVDAAPKVRIDDSVQSAEKCSTLTAWREDASGCMFSHLGLLESQSTYEHEGLAGDNEKGEGCTLDTSQKPTCLESFRSAATTPTEPSHDEAQGTILNQYTVAIPTTTPLPVFLPVHRYAPRAFTKTYGSGLSDGEDFGVGVAIDAGSAAGERVGARIGTMQTGRMIGMIIGGLAGLGVTAIGVVLCCQCCKKNRG